jgi:hypothetical protein
MWLTYLKAVERCEFIYYLADETIRLIGGMSWESSAVTNASEYLSA